MSGFTTSNGTIYDPNGNVFVARGVNIGDYNTPSAATLQAMLPGINFVRLAVNDYPSPQSLASSISDLTSHGIVVEIENHASSDGQNRGGATGQIFTGSMLTQEQNWYSSIASYFSNNPYVWFGTDNEPSETDANGQNDPAALSAWQQTTYNTIRNAGNNAPIMLESTSWGVGGTDVGYNASDYSGMHNVIWDQHYYGWLSGYSTDQNTNNNTLDSIISENQAIKGADGTMPVIIGEYGNSTDGVDIDPNATQVINAVQSAVMNGTAAGSAAWVWGTGNPGDGMLTGSGGLSSYGQQIAAGIAAEAAASPSSPPTTPTPPTTPSADNTVVKAGST